MNSVKWKYLFKKGVRAFVLTYVALPVACMVLAGCGDNVRLPSAAELEAFEQAGLCHPTVDTDRLVKARLGGGAYRVVAGDVLELTMPGILQVVTAYESADSQQIMPYVCRIGADGMLTLPLIGRMAAAGLTLGDIESAIVEAYHPRYIASVPSVLATVRTYRIATVSVTGAVKNPGVYELPSHKMTLVAALMEAGGIIEQGAAVIRVTHAGGDGGGTMDDGRWTMDDTRGRDALDTSEITAAEFGAADFKLRFQPTDTKATTGKLIVEMGSRYISTRQFDLADSGQVIEIVRQLERAEPELPIELLQEQINGLRRAVTGQGEIAWTPTATPPGRDAAMPAPPTVQPRHEGGTAAVDVDVADKAARTIDIPQATTSTTTPDTQVSGTEPLNHHDRQNEHASAGSQSQPIVLPVKGLNIPFTDIVLQDGDTVEVEQLQMPLFTVLGLVTKPGNYPYPPNARYSLMQAIGFGGGLDHAADPRYATVYRLCPDGSIVSAVLPVVNIKKGPTLADASNTLVKPGDIVFVEHTPRTRTTLFLERTFRITIGAYLPLTNLFGGNR